MRRIMMFAFGVAGSLFLACSGGQRSATGFRLPDGDPARGRTAFLELRCHSCHQVEGDNAMPAPTVEPAVPVVLGGTVPYPRTDGELVTAIMNPNWRLAQGYPREMVASAGRSRMPDMTEVITARQVADVVAFLHTRYKVVPPQPVR